MKTPEQVTAELEVRVMDALQPLRDAAARLEAGASEMAEAAGRGDHAAVGRIGNDLLAEHVRFGQVYRRWLAARPDLPGWRPSPDSRPKPAVTGGGGDERMSS